MCAQCLCVSGCLCTVTMVSMQWTFLEMLSMYRCNKFSYQKISIPIKPIFHQKKCLHWLPNANKTDTNNLKLPAQRKRCAGVPIGCGGFHFGWVRDFRYLHVDIRNTYCLRWGSRPMQDPNANGFMSWWNIGLTLPQHFRGNPFS